MKNIAITLIFSVGIIVSCESALEENLKEKVHLLAPANRIVTTDTVHTFYWEMMEGATHYQLQVVSPRFDSIARLIVDTTIANNQFNLTLHKNTRYEWRVRALNSSTYSLYSDTFHITIQ